MSAAFIKRLDHFTVNTNDLATSIKFYEEVIGLKQGPRPDPSEAGINDFPPGAWLYCGEIPVVHLILLEAPVKSDSGAVDHIAFLGSGRDAFKAKLDALDISYWTRDLMPLIPDQVFVKDPNGVELEVNFSD